MMFSVFTPVYNRRHTLDRVWNSLRSQTFQDFEWVVVDDGSTDGVYDDLLAMRRAASFPVRIHQQANMGKHVAWNVAVQHAKGELFVPLDSDDACAPNALERFCEIWRSIPAGIRWKYSGINVLCASENGQVVGDMFPRDFFVSNNLELHYVHRVRGEKWGCVRTDVLSEVPFPTTRGAFFPEGYVWFTIARKYEVLCVNEPLRTYYTNGDDRLSEAAKGTARALRTWETSYRFLVWHCHTNGDYLRRDRLLFCKAAVNLWRFGLLAGIPPREIIRDIGMFGFPLTVAGIPLATALWLAERRRH